MLETKASFSEKILAFCDENDFDLMEGLTEFIRINNIEADEVPALLTNEFKALLHKEATKMNMFRAKSTNGKITFDKQ